MGSSQLTLKGLICFKVFGPKEPIIQGFWAILILRVRGLACRVSGSRCSEDVANVGAGLFMGREFLDLGREILVGDFL